MNRDRYNSLMVNDEQKLSEPEMTEGWHFCREFDGLLVGPGMGELQFCRCLDSGHAVYATDPTRENP